MPIITPSLISVSRESPRHITVLPAGYDELLNILASPKHKRHAEMIEWLGATFAPQDAETQNLADAVDALARKWSRKPKDASKIKPNIAD